MEARQMVIGQHLLQQILEHCLDEKPYEACGILTGKEGRVLHAWATDNARRSPVYYEVDRIQQEHVLGRMRAEGAELVGIYHSHPTSAAQPSRNDIRTAVHYPEAIRVIVSLVGPAEIRAFLIQDGKVHPVTVVSPREAGGEWHDLRGSGERTGTDRADPDGEADPGRR